MTRKEHYINCLRLELHSYLFTMLSVEQNEDFPLTADQIDGIVDDVCKTFVHHVSEDLSWNVVHGTDDQRKTDPQSYILAYAASR